MLLAGLLVLIYVMVFAGALMAERYANSNGLGGLLYIWQRQRAIS